ncbi:hypothetical protein H920_03293 [Fukomys damarensis]|uniref:Uncharacterized protein n=1 Tax=Fukomys damarensis TaxID=885580 RepID=A0A091DXX4_FUKDA|nr:hypothetical protein H920_03293 [Fukomys damarensis]
MCLLHIVLTCGRDTAGVVVLIERDGGTNIMREAKDVPPGRLVQKQNQEGSVAEAKAKSHEGSCKAKQNTAVQPQGSQRSVRHGHVMGKSDYNGQEQKPHHIPPW